jgi:hypothetical protein
VGLSTVTGAMATYPHGVLYRVFCGTFTADLIVRNDRVIRTSYLLHWLRGATTAELDAQLAEHGWTMRCVRAATPADLPRSYPS